MFRQIAFNVEISKISSDISKLRPQLNELQIEDRLTKLFSRIENIRLQLNYWSQTNLEVDQIKAAEFWALADPSLRKKIELELETYRRETQTLYDYVSSRGMTADAYQGDLKALDPLKKQVADYKDKVIYFIGPIQIGLAKLLSLLASIEQRVKMIETMINLITNASFKLKNDEALVIALKAKDMDKKIEGLLTFTNQRIIYESSVTKKTERQVIFEGPVDSVAKITKEKMGTFKPDGLHIEFKQLSDPKLRLCITSQLGDADLAVQNFGMITSGQIEEQLKSDASGAIRKRFKELAVSYFSGDSFCFGKCKECGTVVSPPIKKYTVEGGLDIGLFDCPTCKKPFLEILKKTLNFNPTNQRLISAFE